MNRILLGLSVGSGLEGADVSVVRVSGIGLDMSPRVERSTRTTFPSALRDRLKESSGHESSTSTDQSDLTIQLADCAVQAVRSTLVQASVSARDVFAVGWLEPSRCARMSAVAWPDVADRVAEQTGLSVMHGFRGRDRAAGGSGHPISAVADFLLLHDDREERLLIHLGAVTELLLIPPAAKVTAILGFDAGPGNLLLDSLVFHGTRGREMIDAGGKKAVQGRCIEALLTRWLEHPYLTRRPPKVIRTETFGRSFLQAAFDAVRQLGAGLPDMLCTATHLIAHSIGEACHKWLPPAKTPRRVLLTGGGVRNGFLWQLVGQRFGDVKLERADAVGIAPLARNAAAAAAMAALLCDGVAGNLPHLTGAAGGRLLGHITPGDSRNWSRCATWLAEQSGDAIRMRAA